MGAPAGPEDDAVVVAAGAMGIKAGADHILDKVQLFATLPEALADCHLAFATTARAHNQAKPVVGPAEAAQEMLAPLAAGGSGSTPSSRR